MGTDGWTGGWVVVAIRDGRFLEASIHANADDLLRYWSDAEVVAIDVPIGLPEDSAHRRADLEARKIVGNSIFLAPPLLVAGASSYEAANAVSRKLFGKGVSSQAYYLGRRSAELGESATGGRLFEVHPELSFRALNQGNPLSWSKRTWAGQVERRRLLAQVGIMVPDDLGPVGVVPTDDVFDAAAAAWSAMRIGAGTALTIPADAGEGEPRIWY